MAADRGPRSNSAFVEFAVFAPQTALAEQSAGQVSPSDQLGERRVHILKLDAERIGRNLVPVTRYYAWDHNEKGTPQNQSNDRILAGPALDPQQPAIMESKGFEGTPTEYVVKFAQQDATQAPAYGVYIEVPLEDVPAAIRQGRRQL